MHGFKLICGALVTLLMLISNSVVSKAEEIQLGSSIIEFIGERTIVFSAIDTDTGQKFEYNFQQLNDRHRPWSTFKIPNLLIAIDTGAVEGLAHQLKWDRSRFPAQSWWPKSWQQDQTLYTAFRRSVPWYFQLLAGETSSQTYREWLTRYEYGNAQVPDNSNDFWLTGSLAISVAEQVSFLQRILNKEPARNLKMLRRAALVRSRNGVRLFAKSGSGPVQSGYTDGPFEGWYIGWMEREGKKPVVFALFTTGPNFRSVQKFRKVITMQLLNHAGLLPGSWR